MRRHTFGDNKTTVTDIKFAPKHYGLMFVTCTSDGFFRIYETPDMMVLNVWALQYEVNVGKPLSSISWNLSAIRLNCPMLAVGSDHEDDQSFAPQSQLRFFELSGGVKDWQEIVDSSWQGVQDLVYDVMFAPNIGRSFDLVGVATSRNVVIISVKMNEVTEHEGVLSTSMLQGLTPSDPKKRNYQISMLAIFEDHCSQVWRVSWNITGTILASSGDDGSVRLWKGMFAFLIVCIT